MILSRERDKLMHLPVAAIVSRLMDALVIESDELLALVLAETLENNGITAAVIHDDSMALAACQDDPPRLVITALNRQREDLKGLAMARTLRAQCPSLAAIYLAALWPTALCLCNLDARERFLQKPLELDKLIRTAREFLPS
jgi:DNA-binding response OmpR family regulator